MGLRVEAKGHRVCRGLVPIFCGVTTFLYSIYREFVPRFCRPNFDRGVGIEKRNYGESFRTLYGLLGIRAFFFLSRARGLCASEKARDFRSNGAVKGEAKFRMGASF